MLSPKKGGPAGSGLGPELRAHPARIKAVDPEPPELSPTLNDTGRGGTMPGLSVLQVTEVGYYQNANQV